MKEKRYHLDLDDYEHSILLRSLNDERNRLLDTGINTDAVDDLIVKVGTARQKKYRVVERCHDGSR